uniref:sarcoplasmic reticulum histidine-rich calcium-binding protein isoform X2 n=1 Tax=Jaculus jaculus TaxID=51337 RepID=UPI001E1B31F6|nr:sarcoplasmic reticulum histidine-rich calcium-binding protein isoform X2 [Jaculus jaculus]
MLNLLADQSQVPLSPLLANKTPQSTPSSVGGGAGNEERDVTRITQAESKFSHRDGRGKTPLAWQRGGRAQERGHNLSPPQRGVQCRRKIETERDYNKDRHSLKVRPPKGTRTLNCHHVAIELKKPGLGEALLLKVPMGHQRPWLHTSLLWATVASLLVPPAVTQQLRGSGVGHGNWNNNAGVPGPLEDMSAEFGHHIHGHGRHQDEEDVSMEDRHHLHSHRDHREEEEDLSREYGHQLQGHELGEENVSEEVFTEHVAQAHGHRGHGNGDAGNHFPGHKSHSQEDDDEDDIVSTEHHHHIPRHIHQGHGGEDDEEEEEEGEKGGEEALEYRQKAHGYQDHVKEGDEEGSDEHHHVPSHRQQGHNEDEDADESTEYGRQAQRHQGHGKEENEDDSNEHHHVPSHRHRGYEEEEDDDDDDDEDNDSTEYGHQAHGHKGREEESDEEDSGEDYHHVPGHRHQGHDNDDDDDDDDDDSTEDGHSYQGHREEEDEDTSSEHHHVPDHRHQGHRDEEDEDMSTEHWHQVLTHTHQSLAGDKQEEEVTVKFSHHVASHQSQSHKRDDEDFPEKFKMQVSGHHHHGVSRGDVEDSSAEFGPQTPSHKPQDRQDEGTGQRHQESIRSEINHWPPESTWAGDKHHLRETDSEEDGKEEDHSSQEEDDDGSEQREEGSYHEEEEEEGHGLHISQEEEEEKEMSEERVEIQIPAHTMPRSMGAITRGPCVATAPSAIGALNVRIASVTRRTWANTVTSASTVSFATSARWSVKRSALQEATWIISPLPCIKPWPICWRHQNPEGTSGSYRWMSLPGP